MMTEPHLNQNDLPQENQQDVGKVISVAGFEKKVIVFSEDDVFVRKIFETDPHKAFELLFKKYYSPLCNHAVRLVYSKQKAEDLVSDIFVSLWNNGLYRNMKGNYRSYLFAAVRNKCLTYLKWELKKEVHAELKNVQLLSSYSSPEEILQASDLHLRIEGLIKGLPPKQQQVFIMSRFEGKQNNQIAATMSLSIKTVEMHISRTLAKLRAIMKE